MKRLGYILLSALIMLALFGCQEKVSENQTSDFGAAVFDPNALLREIPAEMQRQIKDDFLTQNSPSYSQNPDEIDTVSLRVFGIFGDAYALFVDGGPFGYAAVIGGETVNGELLFQLPDAQRMYVYQNGCFYFLQEAVDLGIVDQDDIAVIAENYCSAYPLLAPEE